MRRPIFAGNWKMHTTLASAVTLARELRQKLSAVRGCDIVVAPPFTAVNAVAKTLEGCAIGVAGQDLHFEDQGAFTGAVSGPMLKDAGARYVFIGHSERRQLFGETLESSAKRMQAAVRAGLMPILCVGETLDERQSGQTHKVVTSQLEAGLSALAEPERAGALIAYEPVWAIGTGVVATPAQAQEVHGLLRERLRALVPTAADDMRILYGGSVKPDNAQDLLRKPDIDGALVGGASLHAESFVRIVDAQAKS